MEGERATFRPKSSALINRRYLELGVSCYVHV
jgi:hypothetical protein